MKVSIIVTTYNQQLQTDLVLYSLCLQKRVEFSDIEVIIVDDGSKVPYQLFKSVKPIVNCVDIKVIFQNNQGRAGARNTGIRIASNDFLIFVDGDRVLDELFVYHYLKMARDGLNIGCVKEVYCRDLTSYDNITKKIEHKQVKTPYYIHQTDVLYNNGMTDSGVAWITTFSGNMGIHKKYLEKAGLFNDSFQNWGFEHFELGYRLQKKGVPFYRIDATNYHLAHARDMYSLELNIRDSIVQFDSIHGDPVLHDFQRFLFGELSLQEFETNSNASWLTIHLDDIFVGVGKRGVG